MLLILLNKILRNEESDLGKDVLNILIENAKIACEKEVPICQDTGMAVFFVKVGQDVRVEGDTLTEAINKGLALDILMDILGNLS